MRRYYFLISVALLVSLVIYVVYRSEKTVINIVLQHLFLMDNMTAIKVMFRSQGPSLPAYVVYSLPEGLWLFSTALLSKNLYLKIGGRTIEYVFLPLVFAIILELLQWFHLTHGRFDINDLIVAFIFWAVAFGLVRCPYKSVNTAQPFTFRVVLVIVSYAMVYLSYVDVRM